MIGIRRSLICTLAALSGCASAPKPINDANSVRSIKSVALLHINESQDIVVRNIGGAAPLLFGGVGIAAQESDNLDKAKEFAAAINARKLTMAPRIVDELRMLLEARGIEVTYLEDQNPRLGSKGTDDYTDINTTSDAILNVWFGTTGYVSSAFSTNFQPVTVVTERLLDAKTKRIIFQQTYEAGLQSTGKNMQKVEGCDGPKYETGDQILSDIEGAFNGILQCQRLITPEMVSAIR